MRRFVNLLVIVAYFCPPAFGRDHTESPSFCDELRTKEKVIECSGENYKIRLKLGRSHDTAHAGKAYKAGTAEVYFEGDGMKLTQVRPYMADTVAINVNIDSPRPYALPVGDVSLMLTPEGDIRNAGLVRNDLYGRRHIDLNCLGVRN